MESDQLAAHMTEVAKHQYKKLSHYIKLINIMINMYPMTQLSEIELFIGESMVHVTKIQLILTSVNTTSDSTLDLQSKQKIRDKLAFYEHNVKRHTHEANLYQDICDSQTAINDIFMGYNVNENGPVPYLYEDIESLKQMTNEFYASRTSLSKIKIYFNLLSRFSKSIGIQLGIDVSANYTFTLTLSSDKLKIERQIESNSNWNSPHPWEILSPGSSNTDIKYQLENLVPIGKANDYMELWYISDTPSEYKFVTICLRHCIEKTIINHSTQLTLASLRKWHFRKLDVPELSLITLNDKDCVIYGINECRKLLTEYRRALYHFEWNRLLPYMTMYYVADKWTGEIIARQITEKMLAEGI